jgi:hypothetical protein
VLSCPMDKACTMPCERDATLLSNSDLSSRDIEVLAIRTMRKYWSFCDPSSPDSSS